MCLKQALLTLTAGNSCCGRIVFLIVILLPLAPRSHHVLNTNHRNVANVMGRSLLTSAGVTKFVPDQELQGMLTIVVVVMCVDEWISSVNVYSTWEIVHRVLVVWNAPGQVPPNALLSNSSGKDILIPEQHNTLLNRYAHFDLIQTRAVLLQDDDVFLCNQELHVMLSAFMYYNMSRIIGVRARDVTMKKVRR